MQRKNMIMWNVDVEFHNTVFTLFQMRDLLEKSPAKQMIHSHSYYEIYFGVGDSFLFSSLGDKFLIEKDHMLLIPPDTYHYSLPNEANDHVLVLSFTIPKPADKSTSYNSIVESLSKVSRKPIKISETLIQSIKEFTQVDVDSIKGKCRIKCLGYQLIYDILDELQILDSLPTREELHRNQSSDLLMLEELINIREYTLKDIATYLGYSQKQTARMIEKLFGMSFRELNRIRRIEDIKKLLTDCPNMTVEQIAGLVGFASTSSMYKAFRQSEGLSPLEYRERSLSNK